MEKSERENSRRRSESRQPHVAGILVLRRQCRTVIRSRFHTIKQFYKPNSGSLIACGRVSLGRYAHWFVGWLLFLAFSCGHEYHGFWVSQKMGGCVEAVRETAYVLALVKFSRSNQSRQGIQIFHTSSHKNNDSLIGRR